MRSAHLLAVCFALSACTALDVNEPTSAGRAQAQYGQAAEKKAPLSADQAQRLKALMTPLIAQMSHPIPIDQVHLTVMAEPHINAANGGGGDFYVSEGLLRKANDRQLRGVLAHEIAHADLGHVSKIQTVGAGLNLGAALIGAIWPGTEQLAPVAGQLILTSYSRSEESAADKHAVTLLRRTGVDGKQEMIETLSWLQAAEGGSGGGFLSTHPATSDRIQELRALPD